MIARIELSQLKGTVQAPASKSSMQRALAAALLIRGKSIIHHPGHSDDDRAATRIIESLGAKLDHTAPSLIVRSGQPLEKKSALRVDCGESGLAIRMFTPIAALGDREVIMTGSGSLENRPMDFFDSVLPQLGVTIKSTKGKLPLTIRGPLIPANIEIDGSISSQFLTGLLMAYSAAGAENVSIRVNDLKSRPYIDLTLSVMRSFGLPLPDNRDYKEFYFSGSNEPVMARKTVDYFVEADWSGAAFLLVAGAISGPLQLRGLDPGSTQADKAILDGLLSANAVISMDAKGIKIRPGEMNGFEFNATDCPDLFPPLTALALYCKGETKIKGVHRLAYKESNRAEALKEEFEKMGAEINISGDHLIIKGKASLKEAELSSHHDHRIAMALAVAALGSDSPVTIHDAESVNKSYPDFFRDLKMLGAGIKLSDTGFSDGYRIDLNFSE